MPPRTSHRVAPYPTTRPKKPSRSTRQPKQIFQGKTFVLIGNLVATSGNVTHEQVSNWIIYHGGVVEREVNEETTHVVCSVEGFDGKKNPVVKKALTLKTPKIITFDWIEDCLISKPGKPKLISEKAYELAKVVKRIEKGQKEVGKFKEKFEEGVKANKDLCDSRLHHVYYDPDGFEYKVVLSRINLGGKIIIEKYTLYLFESHAIPQTYMCGAIFSRTHRPTHYWRDQMTPKEFKDAFMDFKFFFKKCTKVEWDERFEPVPPREITGGKGKGGGKGKKGDGEEEEEEDMRFVYQVPKLGRPTGILPAGYIRPEFREPSPSPSHIKTENNPDESDTEADIKSEDEEESGAEDTTMTMKVDTGNEFMEIKKGNGRKGEEREEVVWVSDEEGEVEDERKFGSERSSQGSGSGSGVRTLSIAEFLQGPAEEMVID